MPNFTDTRGDSWAVNLEVAALKRVAAYTDFDLLNLLDDKLTGLSQLYDNPIKLVEILYAICEPQIADRGLSDDEFGQRFAGDVLRAGADALVEATATFYQNPKQGRVLREIRAKVASGVEYHLDKLAELTANVSEDEIKAAVDRELGTTATATDEATPILSNFATEPQASAESVTLTE